MKPVTVCITSCNRFDLLQKTLDSFLSLNTYPIHQIILTEDSGDLTMQSKLNSKFGSKIKLIFNEQNIGPYRSIDNMYNLVETDYIFHIEDDWFFKTNPNILEESIDILEERKDIHQIWVRSISDFPDFIDKNLLSTSKGTKFRMVKQNHLGTWSGFSLNPGLRRKSDYISMFPNGYSQFSVDKNTWQGLTELYCNDHASAQGYRAALLDNTETIHIGGGRSAFKAV